MAPPVVAPPGLQEATRHATLNWQDDLKALFDRTKERFPDVVWELLDENDNTAKAIEEVWGHKGERSCFWCLRPFVFASLLAVRRGLPPGRLVCVMIPLLDPEANSLCARMPILFAMSETPSASVSQRDTQGLYSLLPTVYLFSR